MKKTMLTLLAAAGFTALFAQTQLPPVICGNELFHHILRTHHPELQQAFDATFEEARHLQAESRSPLTIPVVVHVVWKNPEENLPDSVILNQIQVLNEDYNRMNADTANLRAVFKPVAGNAGINFQLVSIVRKQTNKNFSVDLLGSNLLTEVKTGSQGGSDAWDPQQYLNIWVCKIQPISFLGQVVGQILGFAFPPNNLGNWPANSGAPTPGEDGVVLDFRTIGRNNPNPLEVPNVGAIAIRGRTAVHEVGHYLGLRHIWGDGGILGLPNNCNESDGIDDTPFANAQSNFDCDTTKNTCSSPDAFYNANVPDLVENYMDYASEACMNMFTKGQVTHMRNVLQGPRAGLTNPITGVFQPIQGLAGRLFPNPTAGNTILALDLPEAADVRVRVLALDGRLVAEINQTAQAAGPWQYRLDTQSWPSGMYLVQAQAADKAFAGKLRVTAQGQ